MLHELLEGRQVTRTLKTTVKKLIQILKIDYKKISFIRETYKKIESSPHEMHFLGDDHHLLKGLPEALGEHLQRALALPKLLESGREGGQLAHREIVKLVHVRQGRALTHRNA